MTPEEQKEAEIKMAMTFATQAADAKKFDSDADRADFISAHFANTMRLTAKAAARFNADARKAAEAHIAKERLKLHGAEREKYIAKYARDYATGADEACNRIRAIIESPEARHRKTAAMNIALTGLDVEMTRRVLASLPERREAAHLRLAFDADSGRQANDAQAKVDTVLRAAGLTQPDSPDAA